jgi:hypothetical protein
MAIERVTGTLDPVQPNFNRKGYARFNLLRIVEPDGKAREFRNVATGGQVSNEIIAGGQGTYYFTTAEGALGLFGVRRPDGAANYAHFSNVEIVVLVGGLLGTLAGIARFVFGFGIPALGYILGPPLLAAWFYLNLKKQAARRAFEADNA